MSPKLYPNYGNSRGVQKSHICVFQTLFGAHIPMTRAATWIVPFGDSHNNSARHRGGSLTHLTGADAPCRAGYGHCCCLLCWHLPSGKTTRGWAITPCSAKHCFGSLATAHHMRVWGYQSSTWLNGLVAFYMKRCKFAEGPDLHWQLGWWFWGMQNGNQTLPCLSEQGHILHILVNIKKKQEDAGKYTYFLPVKGIQLCNTSPHSSFSVVDHFIFSHQ